MSAPAIAATWAPARTTALDAGWLRAMALSFGADFVGLASADDPALAGQLHATRAFLPGARTYISLGIRVQRENTRTPDRSLFNLEQHRDNETLCAAARRLAIALEDAGSRAVYIPPAFPMDFSTRLIVSHKTIAEAAGLGRTGLNRLLLHPVHGSCILLTTVLVDRPAGGYDRPLAESPCFNCGLCVAVCPTGAICPDGQINATACLTHNYRHRLGGFQDWAEALANSHSARDYRARVTDLETLEMWQGLTYEASNRCGYCLAVCPAGKVARREYDADRGGYLERVLKPLTEKREVVYAFPGSDAAGYAERHFPNKTTRLTRYGRHINSVAEMFALAPIAFQRGQSQGLSATYHFAFSGREPLERTVCIRDGSISVQPGLIGAPDVSVRADSRLWLRIVNHEANIALALLTGRLRVRGPLALLRHFSRCMPA